MEGETPEPGMADFFKTAPAEVIRYFDTKTSKPTFDWRDIAPAEHAFSFTVAKSAGYDILDDIRAELSAAIRDQVPFEIFRQSLTPILQKKGWWGRTIAIDPKSGFKKEVQLGSPRRLRTIYWANTRTAYAAGEWERTERNKDFLPFILYQRTVARDPRQEHLTWVGIVLPVDHPFWDTHYPPNGWGCECSVRQITRREAVALGWQEGQEDPVIIWEDWTNKRTGQVERVPQGIDPGWAQNPGKNRAQNISEFLGDHIAAMPEARQKAAIADIVASPLLAAMAEDHMPGAWLPVAPVSAKLAEAFGAKPSALRLSSAGLAAMKAEGPLDVADLRNALAVAADPKATVKSAADEATLLGESGGSWWQLVIKTLHAGEQWWLTSLKQQDEATAAKLIARSRKNGGLLK